MGHERAVQRFEAAEGAGGPAVAPAITANDCGGDSGVLAFGSRSGRSEAHLLVLQSASVEKRR